MPAAEVALAANRSALARPLTLALAGNPNCGKSALFNALTGIRQTTGNWPGVTVERKEGRCELDGRPVRVIDLPGIYSLDASSLDERVTRDYLLAREADVIVNVVDATNLERNLYFSVQLLEMGVPIVVALNMMDLARRRGIDIDAVALARELGCPVVPVVAVNKEGLTELSARTLAVACGQESAGFGLAQDECVEQGVAALSAAIQADARPTLEETSAVGALSRPPNARWLALKLLEGDDFAINQVDEPIRALAAHWRTAIAERSGEEPDIFIADSRFGHAHALAARVQRCRGRAGGTLSDAIDRVVLSRIWGVPLFLAVMYLMFVFTISIGGAFIDFFDGAATALFVDGFGAVLDGLGAPALLRLLLAEGIGGGLTVVATFIPVIASLYIFLSALEDSGYMARAAFVMDRFMRSIGLPGKAFVPLIVGFGCNVPAVMATRTLENERERKLTILMNPFMSCGARLPVYVLFAAAFFPHSGQNVVFALYLTGIAVALLTGLVMKRTLLAGSSTGFMMELPPYHLPTLRGVLLRTWDRVRLFLREAGRIIVVMVVVLNLLGSISTDGSIGDTNSDASVLSAASRVTTPLFAPMGIHSDNWPAVLGVFSGVLAKEVIVGTLDTVYGQLAAEEQPETEAAEPFDLLAALGDALATIPANLGEALRGLADPLGLGNLDAAAADPGVSAGAFGAMEVRFDGRAGAFAYLLFVLLYFPCIATIGAIAREAGTPWAAFVGAWTTGIAYITATLFYQTATFARHPWWSGSWIGAGVLTLVLVFIGLRIWARRGREMPAAALRGSA
ncbi:Fe(2+) transporter permease subunit FeoB [Thiorhodovibrio frisius]|uniref:Ferrous iron transport protein B n=1 Tax=Thiorhodovibrio frisius TaxID=631362 RepID=H8Z7E6_9GAMM|nr:Fe(2+) transporter permease subunit FeoB [Thiorhodovibrio frisius]EIC19862.1 ferrous iron transporter FeoB [Thiorhodovibrio frisius]WPL20590.1 Ferrous iron transport protein B [Thiorhodovibrio frisius]